jgi:hypothetical protein
LNDFEFILKKDVLHCLNFCCILIGVLSLIESDQLIKVFGQHQLLRKGEKLSWMETNQIRGKLRFLGRLLQILHKTTDRELSFSEFLRPEFFDAFRTSVLEIRNTNKQLAFTLGPYIRKLCLLNIAEAIKCRDKVRKKASQDFLDIFNSEWTETVSAATIRLQQKVRINRKLQLPLTKDLQKLTKYLVKEIQKESEPVRLQKLIMTYLILFNKRRPAEVELIKTSEYRLALNQQDDREEIMQNLTAEEKAVANR